MMKIFCKILNRKKRSLVLRRYKFDYCNSIRDKRKITVVELYVNPNEQEVFQKDIFDKVIDDNAPTDWVWWRCNVSDPNCNVVNVYFKTGE